MCYNDWKKYVVRNLFFDCHFNRDDRDKNSLLKSILKFCRGWQIYKKKQKEKVCDFRLMNGFDNLWVMLLMLQKIQVGTPAAKLFQFYCFMYRNNIVFCISLLLDRNYAKILENLPVILLQIPPESKKWPMCQNLKNEMCF